MKKAGIVVAGLIVVAAIAASCAADSRVVRENPVVRGLFYPPAVEAADPLGADTVGESFDHALYAEVLGHAVGADGLVRYDVVYRKKAALEAYLRRLAEADADVLSRHARLALFLNAYNAFTLKLVIEHPGIASIRDIPSGGRWKAGRWRLAGRTVSLDALEHKIIRPEFGEPRIHFALVCAAKGCPPLRNEPYTRDKLGAQLDDQTTRFLAEPGNLRWEEATGILYVSELLDWFRGDFGSGEKEVVAFVRRYVDPAVAKQIEAAGDTVKVRYLKYDWSLNGSWGGE